MIIKNRDKLNSIGQARDQDLRVISLYMPELSENAQ
jgi:hypothetical protein